MEKFDYKLPLRYGAICFAGIIVINLVLYLFYETLANHFVLYLVIVLAMFITEIVIAVKAGTRYRREHEGTISFGHAFLTVYIVLISCVVAGTTGSLMITKVIDKNYATNLASIVKHKTAEYCESKGMSDEDIKKATQGITPENYDPPMDKMAKGVGGFLGVFAVIALISAAVIKRNKSDLADLNSPQ